MSFCSARAPVQLTTRINFAYCRDPNTLASSEAPQLPHWAPYSEGKASQLLAPGNVTQITDDFRPQMSLFDEPDVAKVMGFY